MRRHLATPFLTAALGAVLLAGAGCGGSDSGNGSVSSLDDNALEACSTYNEIINTWSRDYGSQLSTVGQAEAEGSEEGAKAQEEAVAAVRGLFESAAEGMRTQAQNADDAELSEGLAQAADGLEQIAGQIETYDDVVNAPEMMAAGEFADGGQRVNDYCAS